MREVVTFHRHEIESARIIQSRLKELGFSDFEICLPQRLVELHQVRFYSNTQDITYRAFLRRLGRFHVSSFFAVLRADRAGNTKNDHKPLITQEMMSLQKKLEDLQKTTVFEEDLVLSKINLILMDVPKDKIQHAINNMTAIVQLRPDRNTLLFLTEFVRKNYLEKKNGQSKGLPDW